MLIKEDYFKNIFNTVREGILILDENLRVLSANSSFFNTFKVDVSNTVGSLLYDLGNRQWNIPDLRVLLEDILPRNTTVDNFEIVHEFESIGKKTMLLNARKIAEKKNDLPIILLAIEDITERKEIEAGLENTRKELEVIKITADEVSEYAESIINTVREPLIALDQDLRVVSVSRSFYEFFKVNPEETVGQLIYDLGNKQWDIPKLRELLETILPQKATFDNYEVEHDFTTIGRRVMLLNARQIHRVLGKEQIILLAIEDITERKRLEDSLAESEERYRRLFETASDGIILLEKSEGHITHANPAAGALLGYSNKEFIGKKLHDIGVPLGMRDFPTLMQTLSKSGIINYADISVRSKSGQHIHTDIYMVDRARLVQCNIRNISERQKSAESLRDRSAELETVNKELGAFIYSAAHDLRTPLRAIGGFADIVAKRYGSQLDEKGNDYLGKILKGTERMSNVIDDLLNLSNVSRQEVQRESVDLSEMASSILTRLREAAPGRRVEVILQESLMVYADPGLMEIALSNLIGNAWKFTSKNVNACIEFGTIKQDGKTVYFIKDNGAGFEQEYVDRMFRPFHRLHSASEFDGTGIGLAIVERIILRHGGRVWADGEVGRGATIHFTLD
jgi:PAS domain S-box-containing protein